MATRSAAHESHDSHDSARPRSPPTCAPAVVSFPGDVEHIYEAQEPETLALLLMEYP
jgi:hypothetical protein